MRPLSREERLLFSIQNVVAPRIKTEIQDLVIQTTIKVTDDLYKRTTDHQWREGGLYPPDYYFKLLDLHKKSEKSAELAENGSFINGLASEEYFEMVPDPKYLTGLKGHVFRLKEGKCPIKALDAMEKGLTLLDCGAICSLIYHKVLREVFKDENGDESRFKTIFSASSPNRLEISIGHGGNGSIKPFIIDLGGEPQKGDVVHIENLKKYKLKHPLGRMPSHNMVVDRVDGEIIFRGMDLPPEGVNQAQLEEFMVKKYNLEPKILTTSKFINDALRRKMFDKFPQYSLQDQFFKMKATVEEYKKEGGAKIRAGATPDYSNILYAKLLPLDALHDLFRNMIYT